MSLKVVLIFANSSDPYEMQHYAGSSYFSKVLVYGLPEYKGISEATSILFIDEETMRFTKNHVVKQGPATKPQPCTKWEPNEFR